MVTIAQDVKMEFSSRTSKSDNFGVNFRFWDGIPSIELNSNKGNVRETKQVIHHRVNIGIKIPGDCNKQGCREQANQAFQLANNALHGGSKQKKIN